MAQNGRKSILPKCHHGLEQALLVPSYFAGGIGAQTLHALNYFQLPMPFDRILQTLLDEGSERCGEQFHAFEHILTGAFCHV